MSNQFLMEGFQSVSEIKKKVGMRAGPGRGAKTGNKGVALATDKRSKDDSYALRLNVGISLLKAAGIIEGDRVEVFFSEKDRKGLIRRSNANGSIKVSFRGKKSAPSIVTVYVKGLPSVAHSEQCTDVQVNESGIMFSLPDSASFSENLRKQASAVVDQ